MANPIPKKDVPGIPVAKPDRPAAAAGIVESGRRPAFTGPPEGLIGTRTTIVVPNDGAPARSSGPGQAVDQRPPPTIQVFTHEPDRFSDPRLIMLREPDSPRAASFRVLRHRLLERGDPRAIAITSAGPQEGKTTAAVNLAVALSECGRARVLLLEANLRSPALATMLRFSPPSCFARQLAAHREQPAEKWVVVQVLSQWLHVAAVDPGIAGRPLLDAPAFAIAMAELRRAGYDYIVVDTAPVLGSADVNLVQDAVDGVLLVAWAGRSEGAPLRRAVEQLATNRLLGLAMLDV